MVCEVVERRWGIVWSESCESETCVEGFSEWKTVYVSDGEEGKCEERVEIESVEGRGEM